MTNANYISCEELLDLITSSSNGYSLNYDKAIPILVGAIQEQQKQIEELKQLIKEKL